MWAMYHVKASCPVATSARSQICDSYALASRTEPPMIATAVDDAANRNTGSGGIEIVPTKATAVSSSVYLLTNEASARESSSMTKAPLPPTIRHAQAVLALRQSNRPS